MTQRRRIQVVALSAFVLLGVAQVAPAAEKKPLRQRSLGPLGTVGQLIDGLTGAGSKADSDKATPSRKKITRTSSDSDRARQNVRQQRARFNKLVRSRSEAVRKLEEYRSLQNRDR